MFRRRLSLLALALLVAVAFLTIATPARAQYTLTMIISDNRGNSTTVGPSSPSTTTNSLTFTDTTGIFPEFSGLTVSATGNQTASKSNLNQVQIVGTALAGFSGTTNFTVLLIGTPFNTPNGKVTAFETVASSTASGGQSDSTVLSHLNGSTVGPASPGLMITGSPNSATSTPNTLLTLPTSYQADMTLVIDGIVQNGTNTLNNTGTLHWESAVPEPASLLLFLTGLPVLGAGWLRRRYRKE
jgi:hypothetical protein